MCIVVKKKFFFFKPMIYATNENFEYSYSLNYHRISSYSDLLDCVEGQEAGIEMRLVVRKPVLGVSDHV